jgi:hypothetical protein
MQSKVARASLCYRLVDCVEGRFRRFYGCLVGLLAGGGLCHVSRLFARFSGASPPAAHHECDGTTHDTPLDTTHAEKDGGKQSGLVMPNLRGQCDRRGERVERETVRERRGVSSLGDIPVAEGPGRCGRVSESVARRSPPLLGPHSHHREASTTELLIQSNANATCERKCNWNTYRSSQPV